MKVYILQEHIDDHSCGVEQNVIGVYDAKQKALKQLNKIVENDVLSSHFFMADDFDEELPRHSHLSNTDVIIIDDDYVELYCDGNGNYYNLYILEQEVQ